MQMPNSPEENHRQRKRRSQGRLHEEVEWGGEVRMGLALIWVREGRDRTKSGGSETMQTLRRLDSVLWHMGLNRGLLVPLELGTEPLEKAAGLGPWSVY